MQREFFILKFYNYIAKNWCKDLFYCEMACMGCFCASWILQYILLFEWLNKINVGSLQDLALQKKRCLETLLYVSEVENILQVKHR